MIQIWYHDKVFEKMTLNVLKLQKLFKIIFLNSYVPFYVNNSYIFTMYVSTKVFNFKYLLKIQYTCRLAFKFVI